MEETTSSWSSRRKFIYTSIIVGVFTLFSTFIFVKYWYTESTCFDGVANGDETGIDCGGSCALVCSNEALAPIIRSDPRIFQIYPNTYSLLTFVENHNIDLISKNVPYVFKIYDAQGRVIVERKGNVNLLKNRTIAIFEGNVNATTSPARVSFELSKNIRWQKDATKIPELKLTHTPLLNEEIAPRIEASIQNNSLQTVNNIEIVAVVFDSKENAVATSRTFVESLQKDEQSVIFFTWPQSFSLDENVCQKPSAVQVLIDRSGSMSSLGSYPPQPLSDVKISAQNFISLLRDDDMVGFISFATNATNPPDISITSDRDYVANSISKLSILQNGTQYTNIAEALSVAFTDLKLVEDPNINKVIILLTDGVANRPKNPKQNSTEAEDITYAEERALEEATKIKSEGINIFTIGLGKNVHEDFLKKIASPSVEGAMTTNYFFAPTTKELTSIYNNISSFICKETPARIEMFINFQ